MLQISTRQESTQLPLSIVLVAWLSSPLSLAEHQTNGISSFISVLPICSVFLTYFLPARMVNLAMAMQAPLVKGLPWKTSMKQKLTVSMVR